MTDQKKPLTDKERLRALAQGWIDEADHIVDVCGVAGGHAEVARADAARALIVALDALPAIDSPDRIPPILMQSLLDYRAHRLRPGHFLAGLLANDLITAMAIARADEPSMLAIPAIVAWIKRELPGDAWGSYGFVSAWTTRARS